MGHIINFIILYGITIKLKSDESGFLINEEQVDEILPWKPILFGDHFLAILYFEDEIAEAFPDIFA